MGACNSSAALEPADVAVDGSAPVFWSPEREQEKRLAKLREIQEKQQAEIERATGHLPGKANKARRSTTATSKAAQQPAEEEKQHADSAASPPARSALQRVSSRAASTSLPSAVVMQQVVLSEAELSEYPLPKSARRLARAASASIASPTRSPEVSVSGDRRSDSELSTPRQQSTPLTTRLSSARPEVVEEEEQRAAEEEKECDDSTPPPPQHSAAAAVAASAAPSSTPPPIPARIVTLRPVSAPREDAVQPVDKPSPEAASAAFGVALRRVPPRPAQIVHATHAQDATPVAAC